MTKKLAAAFAEAWDPRTGKEADRESKQIGKKIEKQLNKVLTNMQTANEVLDFRGEWWRVKFLKVMDNGNLRYKLTAGRNVETYDQLIHEMEHQGFRFDDDIEEGDLEDKRLVGLRFKKEGQTFEFVQRML